MAEQLTDLEQRVYHYMIDFLAENTYQPSIREIARMFRIRSTKTVSDLLHSLETKGFIAREESRSRGVRLLGFAAAGSTRPVPYYDGVFAGDPPLRSEYKKSYVTVDRRFLPGDDVFCLKAKGDSMAARGILDGDYVMISPSSPAKDGDIVAARRGSEATLSPLADVAGHDDLAMLGVVCGVFRPYLEQPPAPTITPISTEEQPVS